MDQNNKPWQLTGDLKRRSGFLEQRERILIVCEGEKTEPNYFKGFPIKHGKIELKIKGIGYNCVSLVNEAIRMFEKAMEEKRAYNQVWCVFDKDDFGNDEFNRACTLAENNKIRVAYSNEAFELWYFLHFNYCDSALKRHEYNKKLSENLGFKYEKNSNKMYDILIDRQVVAMRNARKLHMSHYGSNPAKSNPSTKVHTLVEALNRFL